MPHHQVLIIGAGPTGLMLAAELALAGIETAIIERRPDQSLSGLRAGGLHARSIEILDQRGVADRFLAAGQTAQVAGFAWFPLDISDFPTRHPYGLALWQNEIERILAEWVAELNVPIHRSTEFTGFTQTDSGVTVTCSDGRTFGSDYLVGCDGGRSLVRKTAGIEFPGWDPSTSQILAEAEFAEKDAPWGLRRDPLGIHALTRSDDGQIRIMVTEQQPDYSTDPTFADLKQALTTVYGSDFGVHSPTSLTRFTDMARQAAEYRKGRVLLAGDAAHIHFPAGGQGLNLGLQDAVNLGWKLAQVVTGASPDTLLDTYHAERHPIAARVLRITMAQSALLRTDEQTNALRDIFGELIPMSEPRKHLAGFMSGLALHYDLGEGHPLVGRRMPDLDLATSTGSHRLYSYLHTARGILLNLGTPGAFHGIDLPARVDLIEATYPGPWDLPVIGHIDPPHAVLIRPDGYVVWTGNVSDESLTDALQTWFGHFNTNNP